EVEIREPIMIFDLRGIDVIPQAEVESKLGRNPEIVHEIGAKLPPPHAEESGLPGLRGSEGITEQQIRQRIAGQLPGKEEVPMRALRLEESVCAAAEIAPHLEGMFSSDVRE